MSKRHWTLGVFLSLLLVLLMQGCSTGAGLRQKTAGSADQPRETGTPLSQATVKTLPAVLPTSTPTLKVAPTVEPTITISPTIAATITLTPLPTLDQSGLLGLIDHNGGCQLPCWWGIEPGKTSVDQALQRMESIGADIRLDGDAESAKVEGKVRLINAYWVSYDLPGSAQQGDLRMIAWDGIVARMAIGPKTAQYRYTLDQLLSKMGKPSQVFIEAQYDAMGYTIPFHLILYYPNQRFFANYYMEAEDLGQTIRACPAKVAPGLILWAPEYRIEDRLAVEMLGPDSWPGLQSLQDATGLSIDQFFAIFSRKGFQDCLKSPMDFWANIKFK